MLLPEGTKITEPDLSASFIPAHKSTMILFLERVYGITESQLFIRILELGLLPDMKASAQLDTVSCKIFQDSLNNV